MRVAVVGGGRGGYALAADLTLRGHDVAFHLGDRGDDAKAIASAGGLHLTGVLGEHDVPVRPAAEVADAVECADLVALPGPGSVQERYLEMVLPHVGGGQAVWLCQGGGGSLLPLARERRDLLFIETMYLPYSARRVGPAAVSVRAGLCVPYAASPARRSGEARELLGTLFDLPAARDVLEVALQNVNAVLHPLPCLLNWGQIEGRADRFVLTRDGMAPGVLRALEAVDRERVAVCEAVGVSSLSIDQIYALLGVAPPPYRRDPPAAGGEAYEDRFIREAVPVGLVTIASCGRQFGVATPLIDATISVCDQLYGMDSRRDGRTMRQLGLDDLTAEAIARILQSA